MDPNEIVTRVGGGRTAARVLFIGGFGRSGSTLLAHVLGRLPGFCAIGELKFVWERGLKANELCSCGAPFLSCPFWDRVGVEAFGGWEAVDVDEVIFRRRQLMRDRLVPARLLLGLDGARQKDVDWYARMMGRLVLGVRAASGSETIVDSSKLPIDVLLLRRIPDVKPQMIHLVRDSRGVAYSWTKRSLLRPELAGAHYFEAYGAAHTAVRWVFHNGFFHGLSLGGVPTAFVRYEDLVESPRREIAQALGRLAVPLPSAALGELEGEFVETDGFHQIGGNPMRFGGTQPIRLDDEWRTSMRGRDRWVVSLLTSPLLLAYRYYRTPRGAPRSTTGASDRAPAT